MRLLCAFLLMYILAVSCKKDTPLPVPASENPSGSVQIEITNMVDTNLLTLDTVLYILYNGDKLKVYTYKYYISNIKLLKADGSFYAEPYSYHLINQAEESSKTITLRKVPEDDYTGIQFMIGVDSARNVSGTQEGDLDPAKLMFWAWNTGYIMAKMEGTSLHSTAIGHNVGLHIGGFKGAYSALHTVSPSFNGTHALVSSGHIPVIRMKCDLQEWFRNPTNVDFSTVNTITLVGPVSKTIADNYADMFSVTGIYY